MSERRLILLGGLMVAVGPLSITLYTPAMPQIVADLGTSEATLTLSITLFLIGFGVSQLVCGTLSDGLGRKPVAMAFLGLYTVASALALFAPSVEVLLGARLFQGIGASAGVVIARALVRDLHTGQSAARILNTMAIIIAAGPSMAPALGSLLLMAAGYRAIFAAMCLHGLCIVLLIALCVRETVPFDPARIRPLHLVKSLAMLLRSGRFMLPSLATAGCAGAIYGQAALLPFILMTRAGLTPLQFGLGMFMQSGMYALGSYAASRLLRRHQAAALVPWGLGVAAVGAVLLPVLLLWHGPGFWTVMGPVAVFAVGYSHAAPAVLMASFHSYPQHAGAASSLNGFLQIAVGFSIGSLAVLFADPVLAMAVLVPLAVLGGCLAGFLWHRRYAALSAD